MVNGCKHMVNGCKQAAPGPRARIHRSSAFPLSPFTHPAFSLQPSTFSRQIYFHPSSFSDTCKNRHLLRPILRRGFPSFYGPWRTHVSPPPIGHTCPPRPVQPAPWCVKGESGNAKLRCIRARGFFHASCIQTNLSHGSGWASPHRGAGFQPAGNGALCHGAGEKRWSLMKVRTLGAWYSRAVSPRPRCGFTFKGGGRSSGFCGRKSPRCGHLHLEGIRAHPLQHHLPVVTMPRWWRPSRRMPSGSLKCTRRRWAVS